MKLAIKAYAKLNLTLDVLHKRSDGYHELDTIMQSISLYDTITLVPYADGVKVECDQYLPESSSARAAALRYFDAAKLNAGVAISIQNQIPELAGLGGSSADAAGVLFGLNHIFGALEHETLMEIALDVGADVPFCLVGGTQRAKGKGEVLTALPTALSGACVLIVKPEKGVSTAELFSSLALPAPRPDTDAAERAIKEGDLCGLGACLVNALTPAATSFVPEIDALKRRLLSAGALGAEMTGSGSAVFGLFENEKRALAAKAGFADNFAQLHYFTNESLKII